MLSSSASPGPRNDVFFTTDQPLVGQDRDSSIDLYVSRAGGGLAGQDGDASTNQTPCRGDACQGPSAPNPPAPGVGSITFTGAEDPGAIGPLVSASKLKVTLTRRTVMGTVFTVNVKVPGSGTITATGTRTASVRKRVSRAATYTIRVVLTRRAKAELAKRGSVKVAVRVTYRRSGGAASAATVSVKLVRPSRARSTTSRAAAARPTTTRTGR